MESTCSYRHSDFYDLIPLMNVFYRVISFKQAHLVFVCHYTRLVIIVIVNGSTVDFQFLFLPSFKPVSFAHRLVLPLYLKHTKQVHFFDPIKYIFSHFLLHSIPVL